MTDADLRQTFQAIYELLVGLRNAVRPPGSTVAWDAYFDRRLAIIDAAAKPVIRDEKGKFQKPH